MLDVSKLTLGEIAKIESLTGLPIDGTIGDGVPQGKSLAAWALIHARRDGKPGFSWPDALALTMEEAMSILGIDVDDDEDEAPADTDAGDDAGEDTDLAGDEDLGTEVDDTAEPAPGKASARAKKN